MKFNFDGIYNGYGQGTLDDAFDKAKVRVEEASGLTFSADESAQARKGLSPITSGGLTPCLNDFAKNLISNKSKLAA